MVDIHDFLQELEKSSDHERAEHDRHYHKSSREHWGVKTKELDALTEKFTNDLEEQDRIAFSRKLWATGIFDAMVAATRILAQPEVRPSQHLWHIIGDFMVDVDGWCLEDNLARSAWKCLEVNADLLNELEKWTRHENFWVRRAALIFTLPIAQDRSMNPERILGWAGRYSADPEWFIQKAIGWWLRDLGHHNPERVVSFLNEHRGKLKSVAKREATRKLDEYWLELLQE